MLTKAKIGQLGSRLDINLALFPDIVGTTISLESKLFAASATDFTIASVGVLTFFSAKIFLKC